MLETETVLDRRRLRRSVSLWRAAGIAGITLALGLMALGGDKLAGLSAKKEIARIAIEGTITEDRDQLKMLKEHRRGRQRRGRPSLREQPRRHDHRRRSAL